MKDDAAKISAGDDGMALMTAWMVMAMVLNPCKGSVQVFATEQVSVC